MVCSFFPTGSKGPATHAVHKQGEETTRQRRGEASKSLGLESCKLLSGNGIWSSLRGPSTMAKEQNRVFLSLNLNNFTP